MPSFAAQVGGNISEEEGVAAAHLVALNMLATLKCRSWGPSQHAVVDSQHTRGMNSNRSRGRRVCKPKPHGGVLWSFGILSE